MKQLAVAIVVHSERRNALGNPKTSRFTVLMIRSLGWEEVQPKYLSLCT
jgi:hypothetical protein